MRLAPLLLALALGGVAAAATLIVPVRGAAVLQGVELGWDTPAARARVLGAGVSAQAKEAGAEPTGQRWLALETSPSPPSRASLRAVTLSGDRPVLRGTETLDLHGHRDKDPIARQPGVGTRTVMVELPEGAPAGAAVWLSGFRVELGAAHPQGVALQALGVESSPPVVTGKEARFELTATLEAASVGDRAVDPDDYDAKVTVDWTLVPAAPGTLTRLDQSAELQSGLQRPGAAVSPFTLPLAWTPPAGSPGVLAGLSGFSLTLADEAIATRRALRWLAVDLREAGLDATGSWRGELDLGFSSEAAGAKPARAYVTATATLLALVEGERARVDHWAPAPASGTLTQPFPAP